MLGEGAVTEFCNWSILSQITTQDMKQNIEHLVQKPCYM